MAARIIKIGDGCRGEALYEALDILERGGLVVIPTDTVYGVAAHVARTDAVGRLYLAKIRDPDKPIPLLAASLDALERAGAAVTAEERAIASRFWPGPLTLVVDLGGVAEGVRVPDHRFVRTLIRESGVLLRVTSANISGQPPVRSAAEALAGLGDSVDLILDGGPSPGGVASTVASVGGGVLTIYRDGGVTREQLEGMLKQIREGGAGSRVSQGAGKPGGQTPVVVFVCTANMCRSPMAEHLFRLAWGPDTPCQVFSAGTDASDGMPATFQASRAMKEIGVDLREHSSQMLTRELVDAADLIVVMTANHAQRIAWRFPDAAPKVRLLKSFVPGVPGEEQEVPDPIGLSDCVYRAVRDDMRAAMPAIVEHIRRLRPAGK